MRRTSATVPVNKHVGLLAWVALLTLSGCSKEPVPDRTARAVGPMRYDAKTLYETTSYGGSSVNAAGDAVLVHSDESGVFNLYCLSLESGEKTALTHSTTDAIYAERFFPSDDRVIYRSDQGGNELDHLYVRELDGSTRDLTPGEKLKARFAGFTTDGAHFFVFTNERDPKFFDVYRYDAKNYARELVYRNDAGMEPEILSPDGRWLALGRTNRNADSDVFVVDLHDGDAEPRHVTPHQGDAQHSPASFTPDSTGLVYLTDAKGEFMRALQYHLERGRHDSVASARWDVDFVSFSDDGHYRVVGINVDAATLVVIVDMRTYQQVRLPPLPAGEVRAVNFARDRDRMVFYVNSDTSPSNLYVYDLDAKPARRLTQALPPSVAEADLVKSEVVRYSSTDSLRIPALLYKPRPASATAPVPAIVYIHGGPGGQTKKGYSPIVQHLVNHGYAVLGVNNRGSSGYGKTFFHLDDQAHGEKDLEDIVAAKHYLAALDWVDGERIAVMGGSYGGFLTMAAMTFTDEFDAGVNIFGVTNWVRTLESIPPWWTSFRESLYTELGDPDKDRERLRRISPLFHAHSIRRPVLVVQGANDPRVLQVESDEIVAALRANDVPVEYVLFPDEGHGFARKANRIAASDAYLKFLDTHLKAARDGRLLSERREVFVLDDQPEEVRARELPRIVTWLRLGDPCCLRALSV